MRLRDGRAARLSAVFAVAGLMTSGWDTVASAQQVTGGPTTNLMNFFVRGVDTASRPNGNYLVVGGQGSLLAACINAQGQVFTGAIPLNATAGGYASFPRAVYAQHLFGGAGGYMVIWAEAPGNPDAMRQLFARPVSCTLGVGAPQVVSLTTWWEPGNLDIAYSNTSQRFLVAWQTPEHTVKANVLNLAGAPIEGEVLLSAGLGRDPSVSWNWNTNQFGVSFSGETYSAFAVVPPVNVAAFRRNTFNVSGGILTTMTDVAFNPLTGRYVMAWFELSSGAFAKIAEFDSAGNLLASGAASSRLGSYDALSMAFNPVSGTFLLVGVDRSIDTPLGLELNVWGYPFNGENTLSSARPVRYPRVSSSSNSRTWNVVFSGPNFGSVASLIATGFASFGGPPGSFNTPPPAPAPTPTPTAPTGGCTTVQPAPGWICLNGGWVPPDSPLLGGGGSTAPPPPPPPSSSCVGSAPVAGWVCVNGGWVPPDHPLAAGAQPAPTPTPTTGCTTIKPGADWVCVNGGWIPLSMACPTIQPGPNWTCVNGNWLPPQ